MNRILATHVGSLLRPPELVPALDAIQRGQPYDKAAFASSLDVAVADVVRRQAEAGIDIVDDGELSKPGWINYVYDRMTGIEPRNVSLSDAEVEAMLPTSVDREALGGAEGFYTGVWSDPALPESDGTAWVCTGPISYRGAALADDLARLRAALAGVDVLDAFVPAVAPGSAYWLENEHYATEREFVFAFADALAEEYRQIVDAGFMLQVDDAVLWHKYGTVRLSGGSVDDYRAWADLRVEALNHALAGIPPERVRYHVCSGSGHGPHTIDPSLSDVLEFVLRVNAHALLIEQGNARHEHEWRVWEDVALPADKILVPGVVTHHTSMVEHPELVAQRLVRLAKLVGRERVMAGTDCGFAQMATVRRVPEWTQWAKLQALAEGARLASVELWGARADV
jgi:5-methyltetrahydropteroyltriglutamate--homocysteine methyltransferase